MATEWDAARTRAARLRAQRLHGSRDGDVGAVTRALVGLQAQDIRANRLAVRARTTGLGKDAVIAAVDARAVVRTWAMRGTVGLDEQLCAAALAALPGLVAGKALTRAELIEGLARVGVRIDAAGQAPAHLLMYAAMTGLICRAAEAAGDEPTYALLDEWVGVPTRDNPTVGLATVDESTARLARRYLAGYGPAGAVDFAAWAGLPLGQARTAFGALAERLRPVSTPDGPAYVLDEQAAEDGGPGEARTGTVRLVGHFDPYLLGYRTRALAVAPEFDRRLQAGGGFILPAVLVDGAVVATWRQLHRARRTDVVVEPLTTLPHGIDEALRAEVADLGRFLGVETDCVIRADWFSQTARTDRRPSNRRDTE